MATSLLALLPLNLPAPSSPVYQSTTCVSPRVIGLLNHFETHTVLLSCEALLEHSTASLPLLVPGSTFFSVTNVRWDTVQWSIIVLSTSNIGRSVRYLCRAVLLLVPGQPFYSIATVVMCISVCLWSANYYGEVLLLVPESLFTLSKLLWSTMLWKSLLMKHNYYGAVLLLVPGSSFSSITIPPLSLPTTHSPD